MIFLLTISILYDLLVFFPSPPYCLEGFLLIDLLSDFPPQFPIRLGGFASATWPFETHQLLYGAKLFSVVSRFSFPVFIIGLGSFSLGFYFFLTISCSTKLASKEGGNCNNMTFGAESLQSRSYLTTIIQNFILVNLTFIITPHPVQLLFRAVVPSLPMHLTPYLLDFLRTRLFTYSSSYILDFLLLRLCTRWKNIPLGYLS